MKKIKLITLGLAAMVIAGTGCLKDKGFDDNQYGINDPDASPAGVGFNLGQKFFNNTGLVLSDQPQNVDSAVVLISLLSGNPAASDISVQVSKDPSIVADYNTANGTSIIELDPALYTLNTNVIIPAGARNASITISVPNTTTLDPNLSYGLGLKITGADPGYIVASNESKILLAIAIKNQYDGDYLANGYVYHPTVPRPIVDLEKPMSTINATTVEMDLGDLGGANYRANFSVDPITNLVTITIAAGAAGGVYYQFNSGLPTTPPGPAYTPQWAGSAECNNTYDPTTQTFKVRYGYIGGTGYRIVEEFLVRQ